MLSTRAVNWILVGVVAICLVFLMSMCGSLSKAQNDRDGAIRTLNETMDGCNKVRERNAQLEENCSLGMEDYEEWKQKMIEEKLER